MEPENQKLIQSAQRGRPIGGGQTAIKQVLEPRQSTCPVCKSAKRSDYFNVRRHHHDGTETIWRSCNCSDCGQLRTDITRTPLV